jgi:hypothetical protein
VSRDIANEAQELINKERVFRQSLSDELGAMGGVLRCMTCGGEQDLGDPGARIAGGVGWPKCCGYTMRWITARQLSGEVPL